MHKYILMTFVILLNETPLHESLNMNIENVVGTCLTMKEEKRINHTKMDLATCHGILHLLQHIQHSIPSIWNGNLSDELASSLDFHSFQSLW